jgi:malonate-semialdehyde dehydrogenase (acetylating) / methylmalonate-semialdehyde dehydrogenase
MTYARHYIGGAFTIGKGDRKGPVFNPATGEVAYELAYANRATLDDLCKVATVAGKDWGRQSHARRTAVIYKMRELVIRDTERLAELIGQEHGKTIDDAKGEIGRGVEALEFAACEPHVTKGEFSHNVGGDIDTFSMRLPVGIVACISPFNFPVMVPLAMTAMAVATGNAVILKPSERVPGAAAHMSKLWEEAGLPAGVWNVINGDAEIVNAILEHPAIAAISFVGSTRIGELIYQKGTANNKRVAAFTGGKNHMVVMPDADLDAAASAFVSAGYGSASQRCMAVSVVVAVGQETADKLRARIEPLVRNLNVGVYDAKGADFGPVVTEAAKKIVDDAVGRAVEEGGDLIIDGRDLKVAGFEKGFFCGPSLIDNVTTDMQIWKEEVFGPVRVMMRAETLEEAIDIVNAHEYGNGAAIFTRSGYASQRFAIEVEAGMLGVNVPIPIPVGYHNFGGLRRSKFGDGHMFGPDAARFYTKMKTVSQRWPEPGESDTGLEMSFPSNK